MIVEAMKNTSAHKFRKRDSRDFDPPSLFAYFSP